MRIGINGLNATGGGLITYLENLVPALARVDPANQYVIVLPARMHAVLRDLVAAPNFTIVWQDIRHLAHRLFTEQLVLPRLARRFALDVLYAPAEVAPLLTRTKIVLAMRNANVYLPSAVPYPLGERSRIIVLRMLAKLSARRAELIISPLECFREAIARFAGGRGSQVRVVPHGVSDDFRRVGERRRSADRLGDLADGGILSVSTIYRYKNFVRLIEAYGRLERRVAAGTRLVIVGGDRDPSYCQAMHDAIGRLGLTDRVVLAGAVPYGRVREYYAQAGTFVFPSYLESFGHPAVEAMAAGLPLAVADIPTFREVCGDAALYFDPANVDDMTAALGRLLGDGTLRRDLARRGMERSATFDWTGTARRMTTIFEEAHAA